MTTDDEVLEGCGYEYDHKLRLIAEDPTGKTYECRECGAEVLEDAEDGPA